MPWWKLDDVPEAEFVRWVAEVSRAERRAKRDVGVIERKAFVVYELDGRVDYAPGVSAPPGAYVAERWRLTRKGWRMEDGR